jgi:predicted CopG family antitoxin
MESYMVTSIQISEELKRELDLLKQGQKKSYGDLLCDMIKREKRRNEQMLLKEYALKYGDESRREVNEWKDLDSEWDDY